MARDSMQNSPGQNSRVLIITATITAVTTIGVSFIGIVPQLRSEDKKELAQLQQAVDDLKQATALPNPASISADKKIAINGTVRSEDGMQLLKGYDIYLLPEGNNLLTAKTDDTGRFTFQAVPTGVYSIIVRDSSNGRSGKALLDDAGEEVQVIGAKVKYRIQK
jgi:hypothetical protein